MAELRLLAKQKELPLQLKKEIEVAAGGQKKYITRLSEFLQKMGVESAEEIDYEIRTAYIEWLRQEQITEKYKGEQISIFDRLKIESISDIQGCVEELNVRQKFFREDKLFLLYLPDKKKAQSFRKVFDKEELLWDFGHIKSWQLKEQGKRVLCAILNMDLQQRKRRYYLEPFKQLLLYCNKYNIADIEEINEAEEKRFFLAMSVESVMMQRMAGNIIEFSRRILFLSDAQTNWNANVWYMDRFQIAPIRINESAPVKSLSFVKIQMKVNREYLQSYAKSLIGVSDLAISNIRNVISYLSMFLVYLDEQDIILTEFHMENMEAFVAYLESKEKKYSTFNRYIMHIHKFFQFLQIKKIPVLKFHVDQFLKKVHPEHHDRSVPEETIVEIWKVLPEFPEKLQLMYLILFCTGIRKSEVCAVKAGSFYLANGESWLRIYQPKMRKEKVIPVPGLLVELIKEYEEKNQIRNGEYLFKNKSGDAYNGQTFSNQMIHECKIRGIDCGDYVFRAHDYRHSIATMLYERGSSLQAVRDYLGHSSENMTKQYVDFMPKKILKAEEKYYEGKASFDLKGEEKNGKKH